jgi:hypothetical protein
VREQHGSGFFIDTLQDHQPVRFAPPGFKVSQKTLLDSGQDSPVSRGFSKTCEGADPPGR